MMLAEWITKRITEEEKSEAHRGGEGLAYRSGLIDAFEEVLEEIKKQGFTQNAYYI